MSFFIYFMTLVSLGTVAVLWENSILKHKKSHPPHVARHYDDGSLDMLPYARIAARVKLQERYNRYEALDAAWS